jgi:hypothetical protein
VWASYPLRPELVESLYHLYQATRDPVWLHLGKGILITLQNRTRVVPPQREPGEDGAEEGRAWFSRELTGRGQECGYAGVADVETGVLEDHMNSFFLAETLKYLYLLFDDGSNFVHAYDSSRPAIEFALRADSQRHTRRTNTAAAGRATCSTPKDTSCLSSASSLHLSIDRYTVRTSIYTKSVSGLTKLDRATMTCRFQRSKLPEAALR